MGCCIALKPGRLAPVPKLYWVTSNYGYENWFIVAPTKECARYFLHEDEPNRHVRARYIQDLPQVPRMECAEWADLDLLISLGYKVVYATSPRVVRKASVLYREGADFEEPLLTAAGRDSGVYIIKQRGSRLYKIGHTSNLRARFTSFRRMLPQEIQLLWFFRTPFAHIVEREAHWHIQGARHKGEWFRLLPRDLAKAAAFLQAACKYDHSQIFEQNLLRKAREVF